jgi:hypothetical protein
VVTPGRYWNDFAMDNGNCRDDPEGCVTARLLASSTAREAARDRLSGPPLAAPATIGDTVNATVAITGRDPGKKLAMHQTICGVGSEIMIGSMADRQVPLHT